MKKTSLVPSLTCIWLLRCVCTFVLIILCGFLIFFISFSQQGQVSSRGSICAIYILAIHPQETAWGWTWCQVNKHCACIMMCLWLSKQILRKKKKKKKDRCVLIYWTGCPAYVQNLCDSRVQHDILQLSLGLLITTGKCSPCSLCLVLQEIYICKLSSFCK